MRAQTRTGGGTGTNQYQLRGRSSPGAPLLTQIYSEWRYTPPERWASLLRDLPEEDRQEMARQPQCPPAVLASLARDQYWTIPYAVACNPAAPAATLRRLANSHSDPHRLESIARNPSCPRDVQFKFLGWGTPELLRALAGNPGCDPRVLSDIIQLNTADPALVAALQHPRLPAAQVKQIARTGDTWQCIQLLKRPDLPAPVLVIIMKGHGDMLWVRHEIAKHNNCPPALLEQLIQDHNPEVASAAARHPGLPRATLAMWQLARRP